MLEFHADGTFAFEDNTLNLGIGFHGQVAAIHMGEQVSPCTAPALAVFLGNLKNPGAFLLGAVEIVGDGDVTFSGGIQEVILEGVAGAAVADPERPVGAVVLVVDALVVFIEPEVRQHIFIGPAVITQGGPVVVVLAVATDIHHGIDG